MVARQRRDARARILVIDDRVPIASLGAGYPRAVKFLQEMGAAGCSVSLYSTAVHSFSCSGAYASIPATTEFLPSGPEFPLAKLLRERIGCFDVVFVSRPHNMVRFRETVAGVDGWEDVPIIYDAEAIFARRYADLARLRGDLAMDEEQALQQELALTDGVEIVFSVSALEAALFRAHGHPDVRILSYALTPRPIGGEAGSRKNLLFVGALDNEFSPNTDSMEWFVREIMPLIDTAMGCDWCLDVVGRCAAKSMMLLRSERVRFYGRVEDLDPFYAGARVFIAPTRYAAGIPIKVLEAASVGLPVVATKLLAEQLNWQDGEVLLSAGDAEGFAAACVRLYENDSLWSKLRAGGLSAIERDFTPEGFSDSLMGALRAIE